MKKLIILGFILCGSAANAQPRAAPSPDQGEARQFGILVGGTASQYDLCVKKGFLAKGDQSAEETAKSIFEKMRASGGPDRAASIQEGWEMIKKEISAHESFYTQEKCAGVAKEWAKITATMRKQ